VCGIVPSKPVHVSSSKVVIQRAGVAAAVPIASLLLMVILAFFLSSTLVNCESLIGNKIPACTAHSPNLLSISSAQLQFADLNGRLTWGVLVMLTVLALTFTYAIVFASLQLVSKEAARVAVAVIGMTTVVVTIVSFTLSTFDFNEKLLGPVYELTRAKLWVSAVEGLAKSALFALAVGAGVVLFASARVIRNINAENAQKVATQLSGHQRLLRLMLYVGAVALVAGTMEVTALYNWAVGFLTIEDGYVSKLELIPTAMGALNGAYYTIFLSAIFAPALMLMHGMVNSAAIVANPTASPAERSKWLSDIGVATDLPKKIFSVLAILAPMIAGGPLGKLLEILP
jgi:hypothetical protein